MLLLFIFWDITIVIYLFIYLFIFWLTWSFYSASFPCSSSSFCCQLWSVPGPLWYSYSLPSESVLSHGFKYQLFYHYSQTYISCLDFFPELHRSRYPTFYSLSVLGYLIGSLNSCPKMNFRFPSSGSLPYFSKWLHHVAQAKYLEVILDASLSHPQIKPSIYPVSFYLCHTSKSQSMLNFSPSLLPSRSTKVL